MKNFKTRAEYFELQNAIEETHDFVEKIKTVKLISNWASDQLGYDIHEAEAYARTHIANIVRENKVAQMIKRIETDLLNNNIDIHSDIITESSNNLLKIATKTLKKTIN